MKILFEDVRLYWRLNPYEVSAKDDAWGWHHRHGKLAFSVNDVFHLSTMCCVNTPV